MRMCEGYANTFDPFGVATFASCISSINISSLRDEKPLKKCFVCMKMEMACAAEYL
jgi:hypothetical protein